MVRRGKPWEGGPRAPVAADRLEIRTSSRRTRNSGDNIRTFRGNLSYAIALALCIAAAAAFAPSAFAAPFVTPIDLSDGAADATSIDAAMGPTGSAVVVWAEPGAVKARTRIGPGPFNAATTVQSTTPIAGSIRAAVLNGGRYAVTWATAGSPQHVWYTMNGPGEDLDTPMQVSDSSGGHSPEIAFDAQGNVTVVYIDPGDSRVKSRTILQGQTDFDGEETVSVDPLGTPENGSHPTVAAFDRTGVTVAWTTGGKVHARSRPTVADPLHDGMGAYGTTQEITSVVGAPQSLNSDASPDGHATIAWVSAGNPSTIQAAVRDTAPPTGTFSLASPDPLSSNAGGSASEPFVGLDDSGNTTLAWERDTDPDLPDFAYRTEVATRAAGAANFAGITEVSGSDHSAVGIPDLAVAGNNAAVVGWREASTPFVSLRAAGGSFSDSQVQASSPNLSTPPKVAIDSSSNSLVAWTIPKPGDASKHIVQATTNHANGFSGTTNQPPELTVTGTNLAYTEGDGAVAVDPGLTLTDPEDDNITGAAIAITSGVAPTDELDFTSMLGISKQSYDAGTGLLLLTGEASAADYQAALRTVTYESTSENPSGTKPVSFEVSDTEGNLSPGAVRSINLNGANDRPVVNTSAGNTNWTRGQPAAAVDPSLTLQDADDTNLETGVAVIAVGLQAGDLLESDAPPGGVTGSYNAATGTLTFNGSATLAQYQALLRSVRFRSTDPSASGSRRIDFGVSDGTIGSTPVSKNVQVVDPAPQASVSPASLDFGSATVGESAGTKSIELKNTGTATLTVSDVQVSGDGFSLPDGPGACVRSLASQEACNLNVAFKPSSAGGKSGEVQFTHNASGSPAKVTLSGAGVDPRPPEFQPAPQLESTRPPEKLDPVEVPNFLPFAKGNPCPAQRRAGKRYRICTMEAIEELRAKDPRLQNITFVEQPGNLSNVKSASRRRLIQDGDVVEQSPNAPLAITPPNLWQFHASPGQVPVVFIYVFHNPQKRLVCGSKEMASYLEGAHWPGETTGKGNKLIRGAEDLLDAKNCNYRVKYVRDKKSEVMRVESATADEKMKLTVSLPTVTQLIATPAEGRNNPSSLLNNAVSVVPGGRDKKDKDRMALPRMPVTKPGKGALVVRVTSANTDPSEVVAGARVVITDPTGDVVAASEGKRTDKNGEVPVRGDFDESGNYQIVAYTLGDNGLAVVGVGELKVKDLKSPLQTVSGRWFEKTKKGWRPAPQLESSRLAGAQAGHVCGEVNKEGIDVIAFRLSQTLIDSALNMRALNPLSDRYRDNYMTYVNTYLAAQELGLLGTKRLQEALDTTGVDVSILGSKSFLAQDPCNVLFVDVLRLRGPIYDAIRKARGYDLTQGSVPVLQANHGLATPDGRGLPEQSTDATLVFDAATLPSWRHIQLSQTNQVLGIIGLLASQNPPVPITQSYQIDALYGVIASGGGNVIASGGGNVIASGGGNLTPEQLDAIFKVIASGGGNLIGQAGTNFTDGQKEVINKIISEAGGALIGQAGTNMTPGQVKGLLQLIGQAGTNLIGQAGTNLTPGQHDIVNQLIGQAGTNLIGQAGTNLQVQGAMGVIASGGGNITQQVADGIARVIASGGGNLIGEAGTNLAANQEAIGGFLIDGGGRLESGEYSISNGGVKALGTEMKNYGIAVKNGSAFVPTSGGNLIGQAGTNLIGQAGTNRRK